MAGQRGFHRERKALPFDICNTYTDAVWPGAGPPPFVLARPTFSSATDLRRSRAEAACLAASILTIAVVSRMLKLTFAPKTIVKS